MAITKKKERAKIGNIVIVSGREQAEIFEHSILIRMSPRVYNDYGEIKIQVMGSLLEFAQTIINRFKWAGLKEIAREKKELKTLGGYVLSDAYEITLKKIPVLEQMEE